MAEVVTYGGFHSHGDTPKWMVFVTENPDRMDDLGVSPFPEPPIFLLLVCRPQQTFILQTELAQHAGRSFYIAEHLLRCRKETFDSGRHEVCHALKYQK